MSLSFFDKKGSQSDDEGVEEITHRLIGMMSEKNESSSPLSSPVAENSKQKSGGRNEDPVEKLSQATKKFEKDMARELYNTNPKVREAISDEIHGIQSRAVPETKEKISTALEEMEKEISKTVLREDAEAKKLVNAHVVAVEKLASQYVQTPEFRIRFLRTEFFDIEKAALRYFRCLNHLLAHFGENSLLRPLNMHDLSLSDRKFLESGNFQTLRSRDRMGRRIIVWFLRKSLVYSEMQQQKVETYILFRVLAEDAETQMHGAIALAIMFDLKQVSGGGSNSESDTSDDGSWTEDENKLYKRVLKRTVEFRLRQDRTKALPMRWSSIHFIMPNERIYQVLTTAFISLTPERYRKIARTHMGSYLECIYQLKQFGIPVDDIPGPSAKGVVIKTKSLARFVKCRMSIDSFWMEQWYGKKKDTAMSESDATASASRPTLVKEGEVLCPGTDCPESNCVVFGDRMTYTYPANVAFRDYLRNKEQSESLLNTSTTMQSTSTLLSGGNSKASSLRLNAQFLDQIIDELCHTSTSADSSSLSYLNIILREQIQKKGFRFATYDKKGGWYRHIDPIQSKEDRNELRKRISQTIRDDRKRTLRNSKMTKMKARNQQAYPLQSRQLPTHFSLNNNGRNVVIPIGVMGVDPELHFGDVNPFSTCVGRNGCNAKRFKTDHCWADI